MLRHAGLPCMLKPSVRAAWEYFNDMHRPLALQDANLDTFNTVRDQLGKCPFADAIRCAVSRNPLTASAPMKMSERTGERTALFPFRGDFVFLLP